jgi:hypothetical protein
MLFAARGRWRAVALIASGVAVALAPWVIRNYLVIGTPVLLATEGGETMLGANNPYVLNDPKLYGMWVAPVSVPEYKARLAPVRGEVERNRAQNEIAYEFLTQHADEIPVLVYRKILRWLTPVTHTGGVIRVIVLCSYGLLLAVLAVGLVRRRVVPSPQLTAALIGTPCFFVVTAIYWGNLTRGRVPLELLWLPVAVHTLFVSRGGAVDTQRKEGTT